jgi:hypothetical protein
MSKCAEWEDKYRPSWTCVGEDELLTHEEDIVDMVEDHHAEYWLACTRYIDADGCRCRWWSVFIVLKQSSPIAQANEKFATKYPDAVTVSKRQDDFRAGLARKEFFVLEEFHDPYGSRYVIQYHLGHRHIVSVNAQPEPKP